MAEHRPHHDLACAEPDNEVLVGDEVGQRQRLDPRLEFGRDAVAEQVDVVGPHPAPHVAMGDDDRAGIAQHLVAAGVVRVIMRVDDVADRLGRQPADLADQRARRIWREEGVDHQHAVVADDEAGVGARLVFRSVDRGINAGAKLFQDEG